MQVTANLYIACDYFTKPVSAIDERPSMTRHSSESPFDSRNHGFLSSRNDINGHEQPANLVHPQKAIRDPSETQYERAVNRESHRHAPDSEPSNRSIVTQAPSRTSVLSSTPPASTFPDADRSIHCTPEQTLPPDIRYRIKAVSGSGRIQKRWAGKRLSEYNLPGLFREASQYTSGREILKIKCHLSSIPAGTVHMEDEVGIHDEKIFEEMSEEFADGITEGSSQGVTTFRILLEPMLDGLEDAKTIVRSEGAPARKFLV